MKAETKCSLRINPLRNITRTFHLSELAMVYGYDLPAQYIQVCAVGMMCVCVCVCVCADGMVPELCMGSSRVYCEECSEF